MRWSLLRIIGLAFLLTGFSISLAQVPSGQTPSGGTPGGFGGFGGGGFSGGGFGGRGGGKGGMSSMDPNAFFNMMSGGKDSISAAEITDPRMQGMFSRMTNGATGPVTRDQFATMLQQYRAAREQQMAAGGFGGGGFDRGSGGFGKSRGPGGFGSSGFGGASSGGGDMSSSWAEGAFRRLDTNNDGTLSYDEMKADENLLAEKDKWDADKNGFIDLNEYKSYFQARMQQRMMDRAGGSDSGSDPSKGPAEEEKRPVVYRKGKLPKELPSWFSEYDTDGDTQVGLYEWKRFNRPIQEFMAMDTNGDGFLTVEEVLRASKGNASADSRGGPQRFGMDGTGGPGTTFSRGGTGGGDSSSSGVDRTSNFGGSMGRGQFGGRGGNGGDGAWGGGKGRGGKGNKTKGDRGGKGGGKSRPGNDNPADE